MWPRVKWPMSNRKHNLIMKQHLENDQSIKQSIPDKCYLYTMSYNDKFLNIKKRDKHCKSFWSWTIYLAYNLESPSFVFLRASSISDFWVSFNDGWWCKRQKAWDIERHGWSGYIVRCACATLRRTCVCYFWLAFCIINLRIAPTHSQESELTHLSEVLTS